MAGAGAEFSSRNPIALEPGQVPLTAEPQMEPSPGES